MDHNNNMKKYISIGMVAFGVMAAVLLFFFVLYRWASVKAAVGGLMDLLRPFLIALLLAYLLNPLFMLMKKGITKLLTSSGMFKKEDKAEKLASGVSSILSIVLIVVAIYAIFSIIIPELYRSAKNIIDNFEQNSQNLETWIRSVLGRYPKVEEVVMPYITEFSDNLSDFLENDLVDWLKKNAGVLVDGITIGIRTGIVAVFSVVLDLFVCIIAIVYLLNNKEKFIAQSRKLLFAVAGKKWAKAILNELSYAHTVFGQYIRGALADAFILGCIVFMILTILDIPYPLLVAVLVAITNVIPFFGPYIGGIPSAFMILLVSPIDALKFVIIILILQQVEGNIISPKIIGSSTGLSGFWVLFSILFFGNYLGLMGMIFAVPLFAVIYHIVSEWAEKRLKSFCVPTQTDFYANVCNDDLMRKLWGEEIIVSDDDVLDDMIADGVHLDTPEQKADVTPEENPKEIIIPSSGKKGRK